jgi:hypothetical protein
MSCVFFSLLLPRSTLSFLSSRHYVKFLTPRASTCNTRSKNVKRRFHQARSGERKRDGNMEHDAITRLHHIRRHARYFRNLHLPPVSNRHSLNRPRRAQVRNAPHAPSRLLSPHPRHIQSQNPLLRSPNHAHHRLRLRARAQTLIRNRVRQLPPPAPYHHRTS